jgi:hypothetical protein
MSHFNAFVGNSCRQVSFSAAAGADQNKPALGSKVYCLAASKAFLKSSCREESPLIPPGNAFKIAAQHGSQVAVFLQPLFLFFLLITLTQRQFTTRL